MLAIRCAAIAVAVTAAPVAVLGQPIEGKRHCTDIGTLISAQTMESSRSFSVDRNNGSGGYNILTVLVSLTDANTSITRLDMTCTGSDDGNTSDYEPQECTIASGICTSVDAGVWQKASPGSAKWYWRFDMSGVPDAQCTFAVGAGTGAAADLLTVKGRLCTE